MQKEIFLKVYKNKLLKLIIIKYIKKIHKSKSLSWKDLIKSPIVLSQYGYLDELKLYIESVSLSTLSELFFIKQSGQMAARFGHLETLQYLMDFAFNNQSMTHHLISNQSLFEYALIGGHSSTIDYLYQIIKDTDEIEINRTFQRTALSGKTEVCEWFIKHFPRPEFLFCFNTNHFDTNQFFTNATFVGGADVVKWGIQFMEKTDQIESLDFLKRNRYTAQEVWNNAIKSKNLDLLEYMHNYQLFHDMFIGRADIIQIVISSGNISVLDWLFGKLKSSILDHFLNNNISLILTSLIQRNSIKMVCYIYNKFKDIAMFRSYSRISNIAEWFFTVCIQIGDFNAIDSSILHNSVKILKWMNENTRLGGSRYALDEVVYRCDDNSLEIIQWLTENNRTEGISQHPLILILEKKTAFEIVKYIVLNRTEKFPDKLLDYVLVNGDEEESIVLANWILKNRKETGTSMVMDYVISRNRVESVQWLHENTTYGCSEHAIESAYDYDDSDMVEWLHNNRTESCDHYGVKTKFTNCSRSLKTFIVHNQQDKIPWNILEILKGNITLSKYVIDNYPTKFIFDDSLEVVSKNGDLETVKHLYEYFKRTNHKNLRYYFEQSLNCAITNGFIDIVKYFCEVGPKVNKKSSNPMKTAIKINNLEICKYLQENTFYKLKSSHMKQACILGHTDLAQWIHKGYGLKCPSSAMITAGKNGHYQIVRYLVENNHTPAPRMLEMAIKTSKLEFVKLCIDIKCKCSNNVVDLSASIGALEIVRYFVENGYKGTDDAMDSASQNGYLDVIRLLKEYHHKCTIKSINNAITHSNKRVVEWLLNHYDFPFSEIIALDQINNRNIRYMLEDKMKKNKIETNNEEKKPNKRSKTE